MPHSDIDVPPHHDTIPAPSPRTHHEADPIEPIDHTCRSLRRAVTVMPEIEIQHPRPRRVHRHRRHGSNAAGRGTRRLPCAAPQRRQRRPASKPCCGRTTHPTDGTFNTTVSFARTRLGLDARGSPTSPTTPPAVHLPARPVRHHRPRPTSTPALPTPDPRHRRPPSRRCSQRWTCAGPPVRRRRGYEWAYSEAHRRHRRSRRLRRRPPTRRPLPRRSATTPAPPGQRCKASSLPRRRNLYRDRMELATRTNAGNPAESRRVRANSATSSKHSNPTTRSTPNPYPLRPRQPPPPTIGVGRGRSSFPLVPVHRDRRRHRHRTGRRLPPQRCRRGRCRPWPSTAPPSLAPPAPTITRAPRSARDSQS